jgi:enoyl-CoA hydratase/carnithine racemase
METGAGTAPLVVDRRRQAVFVTLNRPDAANALSRQLVGALTHLCAELSREIAGGGDIRALVLTGAGPRAFSAGADLKERRGWTLDDTRAFLGEINALMNAVDVFPRPTIAAINGSAFGGGFELALACDFILAARGAKVGMPEVSLGVIPGMGGTQRLVQRIGVARARQLIYTAGLIDADAAARMGLVNEVLEPAELLPRARAVAAEIATRAPLAVATAKRALRRGPDLPLDAGIALERELFCGLFTTHDQKEGMRAFLDKRAPVWTGR